VTKLLLHYAAVFSERSSVVKSRKLLANPLDHTHKEVVAEKLYLFRLRFSLQEEPRRMAGCRLTVDGELRRGESVTVNGSVSPVPQAYPHLVAGFPTRKRDVPFKPHERCSGPSE
jgi:hypothetical protein